MDTYDYIIRVSKMNGRREGDESTMTVEDQRGQCLEAIKAKGGRAGREHKALNQSGGARQHEVDAARDALEEALTQAETAAVLPAVSGWESLSLDRKRQVAPALIESVEVDAENTAQMMVHVLRSARPSRGSYADVDARFEIYWR